MPLEPAAPSADVRIEVFDTLGSTNAEALARARAGALGPLWIAARRQTAGRGRRGRVWISEPGNLYATLLLTDIGPPGRAAELSFVAALAVHDALTHVPAKSLPVRHAPALGLDPREPAPRADRSGQDPAARLRLKWPNDVLLDGAKVAGILIEGETTERGIAIAIGIGVNCAHHPRETSYPATDLAGAVAPERLLRMLSRTMSGRLAQWQGHGFAAIRLDWLACASGVGEAVRVMVGDEERAGRFGGLDEAGRLVLILADGTTQPIVAGDVFPLAVASGRTGLAGNPVSAGGA